MDSFEPTLQRYYLQTEFKQLVKCRPHFPGVYVTARDDTLFVWDGVLFLQHGLYANGSFKFKLTIPEGFPNGQIPSVRFCSEMFHPSVDPETWELDLSGKWSLWRSPWDEGALDSPSCDWMWHLLKHLRKTFMKIDLKKPRNMTAAKLYNSDIDLFKVKVEESIRSADIGLHSSDNDDFSIWFSKWQPGMHQSILDQVLAGDVGRMVEDMSNEPPVRRLAAPPPPDTAAAPDLMEA